jgi:glucosamine-6-phosphate deaminase
MTDVTYPPVLRRFVDRNELGLAAGSDIAAAMRRKLGQQPRLRIVFASAPSQESTLLALASQENIDWARVTAFHMDEYLGLPRDAPERFGNWLQRVLLDRVPVGEVHLMDPDLGPERTVGQYAELLAEAPIDILCLGIGVNGHLAFNDPPADFGDPAPVRVVELDEVSRRQQVDDGCFDRLASVPTRAITLTIPTLLAAEEIFCMAPGASKRAAVTGATHGPISQDMPASALRRHPRCTIYVDAGSAPDAG